MEKPSSLPNIQMGLQEALALLHANISPLSRCDDIDLKSAVDCIAGEDIRALVDSPSVDASLKDGYAVVASDIDKATQDNPVTLLLSEGLAAAGSGKTITIQAGQALRILTGGRIPHGADAVVAEEFVQVGSGEIHVTAKAGIGRNILRRGSDVSTGKIIVGKGTRLSPGYIGLLAAAGHSRIPVVARPRVGILATGDEVVAPGQPLSEGKLYASNITTLATWCRRYNLDTSIKVCSDNFAAIMEHIRIISAETDVIITSGGAWTGDRDLVLQIFEELGWHQVFHRIRIGPGKAVGFGLLAEKPVFILPGGPPSNLMGFLQIALPGLLQLAGFDQRGLPTCQVRLGDDLFGRDADWTQFVFGMLKTEGEDQLFYQLPGKSRLAMMAEAQAVIAIPEGITRIVAGDTVTAQLLG